MKTKKITQKYILFLFILFSASAGNIFGLGLPGITDAEYELRVQNGQLESGSDSIHIMIHLLPFPIATSPASALNGSNIVINEQFLAGFSGCPATQNIPIEIVALNLVSVNPITVTYGVNPSQQWNLRIGLSAITPQLQGNYNLIRTNQDGGLFNSTIPVIPRLIFTKVDSSMTVILDPPGGLPPLFLVSSNRPWVMTCPTCSSVDIAPGVIVDSDADGIPDVVISGPGNIYSEVSSNGTCAGSGTSFAQTISTANDQQSNSVFGFSSPLSNTASIPTLSQWSLILLGALFAFGGFVMVRKGT